MMSPSTQSTSPAVARQTSPLAGLLAALPYLFLLLSAFLTFAETPDDPYITFRYAANWVAGHGLVYNIGDRVEGFTSPLHVLVCAVLLKIGPHWDLLFAAKLASLAFGLLALHAAGRSARLFGLSHGEAVAAQCLIALNINYAIAAVNGLETTLYTFLVLLAVNAFLSERREGVASAALLGLALLARPDAFLVFVALLAARGWKLHGRGLPLSRLIPWAGLFLVLAGALIGARYAYYGQPLANTFYAKSVPYGYGLNHGIFYLGRCLFPMPFLSERTTKLDTGTTTLALQLVGIALFWGLALLGFLRARGMYRVLVCGLLVAAQILFVLRSGGDWMNGWRFMVPALPFLAVLQCHGARAVVRLLRARPGAAPFPYARALMGMVGAWLLALVVAPHQTWASAGFTTDGAALMSRSGGSQGRTGGLLVAVGDDLRRRFPAGATIAYTEMGYAGYVNMDKYFLDLHGLTEPKLAHGPGKLKERTGLVDRNWRAPRSIVHRFLEQRQPDAIVHISPTDPPQDTSIAIAPRVYRYIATIKNPTPFQRTAVVAHIYVPEGNARP